MLHPEKAEFELPNIETRVALFGAFNMCIDLKTSIESLLAVVHVLVFTVYVFSSFSYCSSVIAFDLLRFSLFNF